MQETRHTASKARRLSAATALVAVVLFFCLSTAAVAEEEEDPGFFARLKAWRLAWIAGTDAWFFAGPSGTWVDLQDTRMTPLAYGGAGAGFRFSDELVRKRWLWPTSITGRYALPQGPDTLRSTYQNISGDLDLALLYRIPATGLATGGALHGSTNLRIYDKLSNSAFNADYVVSIEAAAAWHLPFTLFGREWDWYLRTQTPLFSWVGRQPEYAISGFASIWAPPWRFVRLRFETGLTWPLRWSNENLVRISYEWDFSALDEIDGLHRLRIGTHTLAFSLGTKRM